VAVRKFVREVRLQRSQLSFNEPTRILEGVVPIALKPQILLEIDVCIVI
jgi:hypothetical protein